MLQFHTAEAHVLDIRVGEGVVPYAVSPIGFRFNNRSLIPDGVDAWALPGGQITTSRDRALTVATNLDRLIKENTPCTSKP